MDSGEIKRLMALPEDALLKELGSGAHGAFPQDAIARGSRVLARLRDAAQQAICSNAKIREISQDGDKVALAGAIADLLATQFDVTPAATVSVLIVRSGVANYCSAVWGSGSDDATDR